MGSANAPVLPEPEGDSIGGMVSGPPRNSVKKGSDSTDRFLQGRSNHVLPNHMESPVPEFQLELSIRVPDMFSPVARKFLIPRMFCTSIQCYTIKFM